MSSLSELEYSALAAQTGVSGVTLDAQRVIFYDSQTGKSGSNPLQAEISFLQQETNLSTSNLETLWRTYLINQGVTYQANLNDMKRDFWLNYGYTTQTLSEYIQSLSGLVAYYPLDETSGDAINHAPDTFGTLNGTVTGATQGAAGLIGTGYDFDGVDDIVTVSDNDALDLTTNFSGFVIAKLDDYGEGTAGRLFDKENGSGLGYSLLAISSNSTMRLIRDGNTTLSADTNSVPTGQFVMLGFSFDGANVHYYSNGVSAGSPANTSVATANLLDFTIGGRAAGDRNANGILQHVGLVNRVLTPSEHLILAQKAGL